MAQASADIVEADLEQRILQELKNAGSPMKAAQLAKECKVPKKNINQALYRMKEKLQVHDAGSATWCLREDVAGALVPTAPAQLSLEPVQVQERIRRLLAGQGPMKAVNIARALGMTSSRDVNRYLYEMQKDHLLNLDKKSNNWEIYQPERAEQPHLHRELRSRPDWTREQHREVRGPCGERLRGSPLPPSTARSGSPCSGARGWTLGAAEHPHRQLCAQTGAAGTRQRHDPARRPGHGPRPQPPRLCHHSWPRGFVRNSNAPPRTSARGAGRHGPERGGGQLGPDSPHQVLPLGGIQHRQRQQPESPPVAGRPPDRGSARGQPRAPRAASRGRR
ncbi:Z-DNA-binding protein 1 [Pipistrellus kuhlii]|uniref:Z-DNA-binding protein 1 n=1 Tax=Pipistrellus kuhlii TaxID=59472 RepID=UPI001E2722F1|nr:Z-DNA-binding protein 1 [Pipistrellus kuhlii]